MSTNPSPFFELNYDGPPPARPRPTTFKIVEGTGTAKMPDIRRQALSAIEALMASSDPETAGEREQLQAFVEAHPGRPEIALAEHLLALRPYLDIRRPGPERRP
jgi:hypothetical protein